jgi:NAD(P)-dependent dehydrogenase (short-subunit alcohol dehydrogenase family)
VSYNELTTVTVDKISDNITYYKCDVSNLEEVEAVAKRVIEEVSYHPPP